MTGLSVVSLLSGVLEALFENQAMIYGDNYGSYIVGVNIEKNLSSDVFSFEKSTDINSSIYGVITESYFASGSTCDIRISYLDNSGRKASFKADQVKNSAYPDSIV